ncbi:BTAD domain-containing putative transcriptional regulator [Streptomyces sp. NPDC050504]|uniref:BTAD domain-containing putative transcriptional regulator n=1 Tax=Streptomyces sp. NPDC050504 TaxID=3365618 RepID=UPI00379D85D8
MTGPPPIGALGALSVSVDSRSLELGPPRQRAVLALLLIGAGSVVSVDAIIMQIWGDTPPATANATLQSYVSRLRRLLADCVLPDGTSPRLLYQQPGYALVIDPEHVDAHRFERAVRVGGRLAQTGSVEEAHAVLSSALGTWAGTPYEELNAYDFAVQEAGRLEQLRLSAVESWAQCALRLGREEDVLHPLAVEAQRNPLRERLIGLYMHAQYRLGRQADALRTYEDTRRALAEEIGTDPGRPLAALHAAILRQDCSLDRSLDRASEVPERDTRTGVPGETAPGFPGRPPRLGAAAESARVTSRPRTGRGGDATVQRRGEEADQPVFVGRDDELRTLLECAVGAFHTSGRVAFVVGEAGIGKTRLVSELTRTIRGGARAAWTSCSESEDKPDYWPWTTLLRRLKMLWPERVRRLPDWIRHSLAHLLPEMCSELCDPTDHEPGARSMTAPLSRDGRFTLHDAVCQALLRTVCEPTVLVVEDVDRADAPSLAVLRLFVEQLRTVPVLLVVTTRTFQLAHDAELRRAEAVILQSLDARRILLNPLDLSGTESLAKRTLGDSLEPHLLERLHRRTAGNPYFLGYLLHVRTQGLGVGLDAKIPHELAGVVLQRLSGLPPGVRRVLELCAVMENGCEQRAVEATLRHEGISTDTVVMALRGGLLEPDPSGVARLRFVHPLVREAVRHDLEHGRPALPTGEGVTALSVGY